ncbi:MAG: T9SS type A sorting domain-containing protein [Lewinellaceae bacterium]|nr:T9SS type A sorting domain-containing protein [Lewinellaceae bacterium]
MRIISFLFLLSLPAETVSGQTFSPVPGPLLEQEIALELANECTIFFENPGGDTLRLRWKAIEVSHPETWVLDLCDFGLCYIGIPPAGLMNPAAGAERPYLKLIVQPGATPGAAWLGFRVWEDGNPANFSDVFFSLHTSGITSAPEPERLRVRVFPNPTAGLLFLENPAEHALSARMLDAAGREIWRGDVAPQERRPLNLSAWPAGFYFLNINGETLRVQRM